MKITSHKKGKLSINGEYFSQLRTKTQYNSFYNNTNDKVRQVISTKSFRNIPHILNNNRKANRTFSMSYISKRHRLKGLFTNTNNDYTCFTPINNFEFQINTHSNKNITQNNFRLNSLSNYFNAQERNKLKRNKNYKVKTQLKLDLINNKHQPHPNYPNYNPLTPLPIQYNQSNSLYMLLNKRKNDYFCGYGPDHQLPGTKGEHHYKFNKCLQMQNIASFGTSSKRTYILDARARQIVPIMHDLKCNNVSEKERYEKLITKLYKLRQLLEHNSKDKEIFLIKEFLMNNGIYEPEYYDLDKINNFSRFIHGDLKMNVNCPTKEILTNILLNKNISDDTNTNTQTTHCSSRRKIDLNKYNEMLSQKYSYLKEKKNVEDKRTGIDWHNDLHFQGLITNHNGSGYMKEFDIINKPQEIVDYLSNEFEEQKTDDNNNDLSNENNIPKNNKQSNYNERIYGKKKLNIDYDELIKNNKLTDYICLVKAKNIYKMNTLQNTNIPQKK